jgi:RHS repeat-associated protein
MHADHLGSTESITNDAGKVIEKRSYDVYGTRRNPIWGGPSGAVTSKTSRGFTGHEEDDEFGLVNMKGRIMDPLLGRFTTTDPVITDIFDGQSLNKYSYVNGNPLAFVDPTGFSAVDSDAGQTKTDSQIRTIEGILVASDSITPRVQINPAPTPGQEVEEDRAESLESTSSLRFTGDMGTTGNGAGGLPQETPSAEPSSWRENPYVNGIGGFAVGLLEGIIPGSALSYQMQDSLGEHDGMMRQARIGRSLGQLFGGAITAGIGLMGEAAATGFVLTGIGSVVGVPVAAVSTVAVIGGTANIIAGLRGLAQETMGGGGGTRGPPNGSQSSSSSGWRVGDDIYKPTATGAKPNWSTVRARYWKNEAASDAAKNYSSAQIERMKRGLAPQRYSKGKGGMESKDLSHEPTPAREGGTNLVPRWPQDHANVDSYRRPGY